ncbi:TPA: hypothetical protein ACF3R9_003713 [Serratia marcescens]
MNKLSELSKPVAEVVSKFGDPEAFGEREIKLLTGIQQMAYGTKFYSQEYVSALLELIEELEWRGLTLWLFTGVLFDEHHDHPENCAVCMRKRAEAQEKAQ